MLDVSGRTNEEIKQLLTRVWLRQVAMGLLIFAAGSLITGTGAGLISLAGGVLWGVLDGGILLAGTVQGLAIPIEDSKKQRWKIYFCRLITGCALIIGMLCLELRVAETFLGYIALHICFFINLQYFTNPKR